MSHAILDEVYELSRRALNISNDPRVGSARDNSTGTSAFRVPTGETNSSSVSTLFMTFLPVAIYAAVCLIIFWVLRRRYDRVYAPRTFLSSLEAHERTAALPSGWFNWIVPFYKIPDTVVLNSSSLDGFFFLRYLKILCVICLFGICLTWPILLPLHYYGGGGTKELDSLTFGNVSQVSFCYVHAFLAWIFFGFVLFMVTRECVYFINMRQAYLLSPYYANRLSSRTVLFTCVPQHLLDERKLRRVFGDTVKRVWIPREAEDLDQLVNEREQTAERLERAEILLIKKANAAYRNAVKNGHPDMVIIRDSMSSKEPKEAVMTVSSAAPSSPGSVISPNESPHGNVSPIINTNYGFGGPLPDVNGSVAAQWIPASQRPTHRPIANYGRSVDTIKWTRNRLKVLAPKISKLKKQYRKGEGEAIPAAFIEFHTQVDAQAAYQTLAHHRANNMVAEIVGVRPHEIVWNSLYLRWWERVVRRFAVQGTIAVMVVFWSIPSAIVGAISNVESLSEEFVFLSWLTKLPKVILGLISGLLPAIALTLLMAVVPIIMRYCARQAGVPTKSRIELFVQNSYFVFQVIQVFLVTTITSAASAALGAILKNPMELREILSANLPKASNFYISYFILQGFAMSATRLVHLGGLFRHQLMANAGGKPRIISRRYHRLRRIHWGSLYPIFTNMGVIAITYSLIAPIVLGVALIGLFLIYLSYRYNLLFIYSSERDTRGLCYPRALKQTLTGIYLAEICMVGLFGIKGAYIPVIMMFGLIVFSALVHISLNIALSPLLYNLPRTLAAEEELRKSGNHPFNAANLVDKADDDINEAELQDQNAGYDSDFDPSDPNENSVSHTGQNSRGIEGADAAFELGTTTIRSFIRKRYNTSPLPSMIAAVDFWSYWTHPDPGNTKPNFALKFLHPEIFSDYHILRQLIPTDLPDISYDEGVLKDAFSPPSVRNKSPKLWIPRDGASISPQEVAHSGKVIEISDMGAWLDEKGWVDIDWDGETSRWVLKDWERVRF